MDRNLLIAIIVSTLILVGFYTFFPPKPHIQTTITEEIQPETAQIKESVATSDVAEISADENTVLMESNLTTPEKQKITIHTPLYTAEMDTEGGILKSFLLAKYKYGYTPPFDIKKMVISLFTGGSGKPKQYDPNRLVNMVGDFTNKSRPWEFSIGQKNHSLLFHANKTELNLDREAKELRLSAITTNGLEIRKIITFNPDSYLIDMEVRVLNRTGKSQSITPNFVIGAGDEEVYGTSHSKPKQGITYLDGEFETYDGSDLEEKPLEFKNLTWIGVMDTYFVNAVKPLNPEITGKFTPIPSKYHDKEVQIPVLSLNGNTFELAANKEYSQKLQLFIGPKKYEEMNKFDPALYESLDLILDFLANPLLALLRWLNGYIANWGFSIIVLTIIVRGAMFPLALKSMTSMKRMSKLGPKMKKMREKYKGDKDRLNKEMMALYQKNKVNPVGGCLPMVVQIPIFIALYSALLPAIELRHEPFIFWYQDLSAADFTLLLPILMGVSMYFQQSLTPTAATMDPTQAKMMKWMPVVMTFFFLDFPVGLVLYWAVSNLISIVQQLVFNRIAIPEVVD